jgi:hypothetical protein
MEIAEIGDYRCHRELLCLSLLIIHSRVKVSGFLAEHMVSKNYTIKQYIKRIYKI